MNGPVLDADNALRYAASVASDPAGAVNRWKMLTGGKAVGVFPLYVPGEILEAAGLLPVTLWGDEFPETPPADLPPFVCSVARNVLSAVRSGMWKDLDAFAVPSTCDTLQNGAEVIRASGDPRPLFPLVFPASGSLPGAAEYLLDRIEAFREWAGRISGTLASEGSLEKSVRTYDESRELYSRLEERMAREPGTYRASEYQALCRSASFLPRAAHAEILRAALARPGAKDPEHRARIFLSGMAAPGPVMAALDAAGAAVVGDDLGRGHRFFAGTPAAEGGDLAVHIARRHLSREPCPTLHATGDERIAHVLRRAAECGADRVLFLRMRQCEPEGGDGPDLAGAAAARGIPFLDADVDLSAAFPGNWRTRIEAFVESGE